MSATTRVQLSRAVLISSALVGTAILWIAIAQLHPSYGRVAATVVAAAALWTMRGVFSRQRVVLWLEERVPSLRYALASLEGAPETPFREPLERVVSRARFSQPLTHGALKLVGLPVLLLLASQLAVRPLIDRVGERGEGQRTGDERQRVPAQRGGRLDARVTPPAYARGRSESLKEPASIAALVGSEIRFSGDWTDVTRMPARATVVRLEGSRGTRVVALEPREDSTPRVVLEHPARDSTLAALTGVLRLSGQARDDIGLVSAWFELIVSSGSGESFTFRNAMIGRIDARNARAVRLGATLRLDSLALKPGDVLHLRAVARDANPAPDAEAGSSETRTFRVPRPGENDSVSVVAAPPPEVGQSEVSQRMLIILTERLVARMQRLSADVVARESAPIARDQGRLRKRVGQIIFSRLTGEEHDENDGHDHGDAVPTRSRRRKHCCAPRTPPRTSRSATRTATKARSWG